MQKGFSSVLILVFIVLILGVGSIGYYAFINKNQPNQKVTIQNKENSLVPTSSPTPLASTKRKLYTAYEFLEPGYIKPVEIRISDDCYKQVSDPSFGNGTKFVCTSLGEFVLNANIKLKIQPVYTADKSKLENVEQIDIEFYENGQKLPIKKYRTDWGGAYVNYLNLKVSYLDKNNIYIDDSSGHETGIGNYHWDGSKWNELKAWDWIKHDFPDDYTPNFSLLVSEKYIKVIEENYCCDVIYDDNNPDRVQYRQIYTLDRETEEIIKKEKTPR